MYIYIYIYIYTCVYIHTCISLSLYIYIYIYIAWLGSSYEKGGKGKDWDWDGQMLCNFCHAIDLVKKQCCWHRYDWCCRAGGLKSKDCPWSERYFHHPSTRQVETSGFARNCPYPKYFLVFDLSCGRCSRRR